MLHLQKLSLLLLMLCSIVCSSQNLTRSLNTPERIEALYKINEQRKAYRNRANILLKELNECNQAVDDLTKLSIKMGEDSVEYIDHNLDLQAGLIGLLEQNAKKDVEIEKLKARRIKPFGVGAYVGYGYDLKINVGLGLTYSIFRF